MKRRILFVDDESNILMGLKRMLRPMRHEWDMAFAQSGAAALDMFEKKPFDVIISDMRMPGMDGSQLLARIKEKYSRTVRIVLSGHSDQEMIMKSVQTAHQYLSKPCDPDMLKSIIGRACALRDLLGKESLKMIVSKTESLPSLPSIYTEINEQLQDPDGSIQEVGKIIAKDMSMTAKILQLVNSAFFGIPRHVSSPSEAVVLLGFDTVRSLALTVGIFSKFDQALLSRLHIGNIFEHSLRTGVIARKIAHAENRKKEVVENAFMAGLLHDLGKLILAENFPEIYQEIFELSSQGELFFHEAEIKKLGATHAEVGAYLLGLWGLPDDIVEGVAFHHNPETCPVNGFNLQAVIHAANALEHHVSCSGRRDASIQGFNLNYFEQRGLKDRIPVWEDLARQIDCEGDGDE